MTNDTEHLFLGLVVIPIKPFAEVSVQDFAHFFPWAKLIYSGYQSFISAVMYEYFFQFAGCLHSRNSVL